MSERTLAFEAALAAPPARVFALITEATGLVRWFCDAAESEARAGGPLTLRWTRAASSPHPYVAQWHEFVPGVRASFRGGHAGYPNGDAGEVAFALHAEGAGTRLEVRHTFPEGAGYDALVEPWRAAWTRALARLAGVAGEPRA